VIPGLDSSCQQQHCQGTERNTLLAVCVKYLEMFDVSDEWKVITCDQSRLVLLGSFYVVVYFVMDACLLCCI